MHSERADKTNKIHGITYSIANAPKAVIHKHTQTHIEHIIHYSLLFLPFFKRNQKTFYRFHEIPKVRHFTKFFISRMHKNHNQHLQFSIYVCCTFCWRRMIILSTTKAYFGYIIIVPSTQRSDGFGINRKMQLRKNWTKTANVYTDFMINFSYIIIWFFRIFFFFVFSFAACAGDKLWAIRIHSILHNEGIYIMRTYCSVQISSKSVQIFECLL